MTPASPATTATRRAIAADGLPAYARDRLAAAAALPRSSLLHQRFELPFLDADCWFSGPFCLELCRSRLAGRVDGQRGSGRLALFLIDARHPGWEQPARWAMPREVTWRDVEEALAPAGLQGFHEHEGPSWQFLDRARGVGLHMLPAPTAVPPWEHGAPLRLFLQWAYAAQGLRLAHAATLGSGDAGVLLAGAGGCGKSGTVLAGVLNGLTSTGDDYVLLEQGSEVVSHAVYRIFKLDAQGLRRTGLDEACTGGSAPGGSGKHELDASLLRPGCLAARMTITSILVPEIARLGRTVIEPMSAAQAALALAPSTVLHAGSGGAEAFRFLSGLARRLPAFRARLSEDPADIAGAIASHLARVT